MVAEKQIQEILKTHAQLVRTTKHQVWRLPDGQKYVMASTPSDRRAPVNQLSLLRRLLNLAAPDRGQVGERRPRRRKPGRNSGAGPSMSRTLPAPVVRLTLKEQLSALVAAKGEEA